MEFIKLSSYHRFRHQKTIMDYLKYNPWLKDATFIGTEKLDGTNVQLGFVPGSGSVWVGSRTRWLGNINFNTMENTIPMDALFGVGPVLQTYVDRLVKIDKLLCGIYKDAKEVRIFNEMIGPGINSRIDYGPSKWIKSYSMFIDGLKVAPVDFRLFFDNADLSEMLIKNIRFFEGISEAMAFDVDAYEDDYKTKWEGLVIEPYHDACQFPTKGSFTIKLKTKWIEKKEVGGPGVKKPQEPLPPEALKLMDQFQEYITENRLIDLFSKEGKIEAPQEIGKYIGLMQKDAYNDFCKDNPEFDPKTLDHKVMKKIFNVGKQIRDMLMLHL